MSKTFKKRIKEAVENPTLKTALDRAESAYSKAREEAFEGIDFERLRCDLRTRKDAALADIPALFARFKSEAERVGTVVHQAANAEEARQIVLKLAQERGVKNVVKSKSMLTEEIELNPALIKAGMSVVETDLGEWICQLAGEKPSHFTAPAIHKTREQIAELFEKATGKPVESDIPSLVGVARREIRQAFIDADMGISGANIAIAETGTIVIVSNEGNARLVTSLPDIHVALVGYEKLMPSIDDAAAVIKLLSKSGTGQKMTSYVSFITGPSRTSDIEKTLTLGCHGPKEVHIIFVDNGRFTMLNDPDFRDALCCVKCGACLAVCPVYRSVGGHVFGYTYVGGIGAILAAFHAGLDEAEDIINICAACRRCTTYCPSNIQVPDIIARLRRKLVESHGQPMFQKLLLRYLLGNPALFDKALNMGSKAQPFLDIAKSFPVPILSSLKDLPPLAKISMRSILPEVIPAKIEKKGTVAVFPGCAVDYIRPDVGVAAVDALASAGWEVRFPRNQGCCGMPALMKGDEATARSLSEHNLAVDDFRSADYIITFCPTCTMALKNDLPRLIGSDSPDHAAAMEISGKVRDFTCFMLDTMNEPDCNLRMTNLGLKAAYHDSCHGKHGLGIVQEPKDLLGLCGCDITELPESCCGFAGTFSASFPEVSDSIFKRRYEGLAASGASAVITNCPGCMIQLASRLEAMGSKMTVLHVAEVIDAALGASGSEDAPSEP
ncbi:MAG: L-lactate dehydrogenase (quinone) large subunit LdhH [Armatimonadota bacterium]